MNEAYAYQGSELALFARAENWKNYFSRVLAPYIHGNVLEVGSGTGNTTSYLFPYAQSWTCLEPDEQLAEQSRDYFKKLHLNADVIAGDTENFEPQNNFDAVLYIDVLEHIESDGLEIRRAEKFLKNDGLLIVLAPAHPFLFTPFDQSIGHFRRYHRKRFFSITPPELRLLRADYLDCAGLLASLGNKFFLKSAMPTEKQIQFWDKKLVPVSKLLDSFLGYHFGKSIIGIWRKEI